MAIHKILVIEDEEDIRSLIQTCLELVGGWQVSAACCGIEGLTKAEVEQPDAVLLDMMMPEMDGLATLKNLRSNPLTKDITVILLTAKGRSIQANQLTELDIRGVINKPFKPLELAGQVKTLLEKRV